jgi:hypothetical protein
MEKDNETWFEELTDFAKNTPQYEIETAYLEFSEVICKHIKSDKIYKKLRKIEKLKDDIIKEVPQMKKREP